MNDRELEAGLRAMYRVEVSETETAPLTLRREVAAIPQTVALPGRRLGRGRGMTLLAVAALLVVGGALAAGSGILRMPLVTPPAPAPSFAIVATPTPATTASLIAITQPTAIPTPTEKPAVDPSPKPASLKLTWTKVPLDEFAPRLSWVGDRFVLVDMQSGRIRTSADGTSWQILQPGDPDPGYVELLRASHVSWQDAAVGWWNPQDAGGNTTQPTPITARDVVHIIQPPAAPTSTTPFKGRIESIGIGPRGIVAEVHSALDFEHWVTRKLGLRVNNDWTNHVKSITFKNGILEIKLNNRQGLKVVWADQGFEPPDLGDGGYGWYSPDGQQWTAMAPTDQTDNGASLPTRGYGQVVGVSDGFIASGGSPTSACGNPDGCGGGMWYSADGLTWRFLGLEEANSLLPWLGGALVNNGSARFDLWTSAGSSRLSIPSDIRGTIGTGPLGFVAIGYGDQKVFVSQNGVDYSSSPIPAEMAAAVGRLWGDFAPKVAVGDRSVLVLEQNEGRISVSQSLWLGMLEQ